MPELSFNKSTDSEEKVKLDSSFVYASWQSTMAYGGQTAKVEVGTALVGNGAKIEIKGKSANGKNLGKIKSEIRNNRFVGDLEIPEDIEFGDEVYFEVKLSKNGLSGESDRIPAHPAVRITNLAWSQDEARRGDVLTLSADIEGARSGEEVTIKIYEHDQDGAHDRIAEFSAEVTNGRLEASWEYEYLEDTDEVVTQEEMEQYGGSYNPPEYFFTVTVGEQEFGREQESGLLNFKDWIEIECEDAFGEPAANADYTLTMADGTEKTGQLDSEGKARIHGVAPGPCSVDLSFPEGEEMIQG
jgi:hypothetical protein